ncbi:Uncharacterised protein [Chlamydia trachomatis]|nr:Uncharacterised protein [Chlamydia trachomatis]
MAKYAGKIGYIMTEETEPGVFEPVVTEKFLRGDMLNVTSRSDTDNKVNENIKLTQRISVLADAFALANFMYIRYAWYAGIRWSVNSVEIMRPRLILNIGGPYEENTN